MRSCYRCGREFEAHDTARLCRACKKPAMSYEEICARPITVRERQVIDLVSQAKENKEIAHELHLTAGTVKEYLNRIFRKLGMRNRTELALWAVGQQHGD